MSSKDNYDMAGLKPKSYLAADVAKRMLEHAKNHRDDPEMILEKICGRSYVKA